MERRFTSAMLMMAVFPWTGCQCTDRIATGDSGTTVCSDEDGDGFGSGCARGSDCDDSDPYLNVRCDCSDPYPGCGCEQGATAVDCYLGPSATLGQGVCRGGKLECDSETGRWGPCRGQVLPLDRELCNGYDDDCDGETDEGVLSPCGTCEGDCGTSIQGPASGSPFTPPGEETGSGIVLDSDGNLTLDPEAEEESYHYLYIANTGEGTVSKVDVASLTEVARYPSALDVSGVATGTSALPSRTAVDSFGDVWVANRAHTGSNRQGSVTKIAAGGCIDKNGNSTIETSQDLDGNGQISTAPGFVDPAGLGRLEYYGDEDECVLFTVPVGALNATPRALALTGSSEQFPSGLVFVGTWETRQIFVLDGTDGGLLPIANNPITLDIKPYGAVADSQGRIWTTQQDHDRLQAVRLDATGVARSRTYLHDGSAQGHTGSYGITVDGEDRIWTGGYTTTKIFRFTPDAADATGFPTGGEWAWVDAAPSGSCAGSHTRGVTVHRDHTGKNWLWAGISGGCIALVDADTMTPATVLDPPGSHLFIGVGPDFLVDDRTGASHIWAISHTGVAVRITYDYATHEVMLPYDTVQVGVQPYTYSDFTGYGLRSFTTRSGSYRTVVVGCAQGRTRWQKLLWDVTVPPQTQFCARAVAIEQMDLSAPGTGSIAPVCVNTPGGEGEANIESLPESAYLLIEVSLTRLVADLTDSPRVHSLGATFSCDGGGSG